MKRLVLVAFALLVGPVRAEEGMWLLNDFPAKKVAAAHGFEPDEKWLEHVRLSSVRLAGGCSASFVSARGLVMTNHHCVRSCIEDLSTPQRDLLTHGFRARSEKEERRCPKVEANQLVEITDVTAVLNQATRGKQGAEFNQALKAEMSRLEAECSPSADWRCDVVTLFHGGRYHLYKYRRFQDVRLVLAPEFPMAAFGGDPDNFNFPRYGADFAFLRVWEQQAPAATPHHFRWAPKGAEPGELVFVAGHPGGTERQQTVAQLAFQRDVVLPYTLLRLAELRGRLSEFQKGNAERFRVTRSKLRSVENGLKALRGRHQFLAQPAFFARKVQEDEALRNKVNADPALRAQYGHAWTEIETALRAHQPHFVAYRLTEGGDGFDSQLFGLARSLVRAAEELPKPNAQRLREYGEARVPALKQSLFRDAPIALELEEASLAHSLTKLQELLGADDPYVKTVLGNQAPEVLARQLIRGTRLQQVKLRQALFEGGQEAVRASKDPLIQFVLRVDPEARAQRQRYEEQVESVLQKNGELISQAHVAVYGTGGYPDATFTLRLSYGEVKGWSEGERSVPALTTLGGLFERHTGHPPFSVSPSWLKAKDRLNLATPMNMSTTNDIIGGNSGSPVLNRDGQVVGLIFDGNLASLGGRYGYEPERNRAVAVHGQAILEALLKVYDAPRLHQELVGTSPP